MTAPKEFQGLDYCFALGEVYGIRTWRVDAYGRLKALHVTTAQPWRPGVNAASCHKQDYSPGGFVTGSYTSGGFTFPASYINLYYGDPTSAVKAPAPEPAPRPPAQPPHETPVESCACGFYAYTDPRHEEAAGYRGDAYVTGIVRGSGRTLIGTKGFRSEKAEVVALLDPTRGGRKTAEWRTVQLDKLRRVYPDVPMLGSRTELLEFAPIEPTLPDPSTDEFWSLP